MKIIHFYKKMGTGSLICLLVRKCPFVSISKGKPSISFLLNIAYVVYVVHVFYVVYVVYVVVVVVWPSTYTTLYKTEHAGKCRKIF